MKERAVYHFVKVGNGRLALYHRPRHTDFPVLRGLGCTHVVTLLKESERAAGFGTMAKNAGLEWIWLPVPNGNYPAGEVHERLLQAMPVLSRILDEGGSILIHCSAGIHRTGTVAYGLLRWRGVEREEAMQIIRSTRLETADGMMEKRRRWGDENAQRSNRQDGSWAHFAKEFVKRLQTRLFKRH